MKRITHRDDKNDGHSMLFGQRQIFRSLAL